ncbi:uncharacterized protein LOC130730931 [Lotus japonicus]|uniref:uncharacterized protein LOC130730931 n=1 Tax=Lotus japonicus TaxID=34305 RepID=UPI002589A00D|nr:uncharacterized protein LOC130730931 [Lotus japonicus]
MEGERRKRKLEAEEENEEQKMEKFFALIKSTKEAHDLLSSKEKTKAKCIWNPTFQPEDFIGFGELGKSNISAHPHHSGPSEKQKEKEVIEKDYLQEITTAAPAPAAALAVAALAPAATEEEKEKTRDRFDLNLSL